MQKETLTEVRTSTVNKTRVLIGTQLGAVALAASFGVLIGQMVAENNGDLVPDADYYMGVDYLNNPDNAYYYVENTSYEVFNAPQLGEDIYVNSEDIITVKPGNEISAEINTSAVIVEDLSGNENSINPGDISLSSVDQDILNEKFLDEEYAPQVGIKYLDTLSYEYIFTPEGEYERYVPVPEENIDIQNGDILDVEKEDISGLKNIIIISVSPENILESKNIYEDTSNDSIAVENDSEYSLVGRGDATYLVAGKIIEGYWIIRGIDDTGESTGATEFYTAEGEKMSFADGKTYVEVIDSEVIEPIVQGNN